MQPRARKKSPQIAHDAPRSENIPAASRKISCGPPLPIISFPAHAAPVSPDSALHPILTRPTLTRLAHISLRPSRSPPARRVPTPPTPALSPPPSPAAPSPAKPSSTTPRRQSSSSTLSVPQAKKWRRISRRSPAPRRQQPRPTPSTRPRQANSRPCAHRLPGSIDSPASAPGGNTISAC